jgi:hypothetical protein
LFAAGQFEEAARAAGEVVSVNPSNKEALQIMNDGAARSRGHGADEARTQVARARAAARTSGAQRLAASSYTAAANAEREAQRLYDTGRLGDATVKFIQASGLFRSAEIAAQNETTRRDAAARAESIPPEKPTEMARTNPLPSPPASSGESRDAQRGSGGTPSGETAPPTPAPPTTTIATTTVPPTTTIAPPATPAQPSAAELAAARDSAISDVLGRYKSAVESRNIEALKRIWPGLPEQALRDEFRHAKSISVGIVDPRISATNDSATITFVRHYEVVADGEPLRSQSNVTMELRRNGNAWMIERIRYDTRR